MSRYLGKGEMRERTVTKQDLADCIGVVDKLLECRGRKVAKVV
jgi:hypothetical protein